jgi:hypothetical protein
VNSRIPAKEQPAAAGDVTESSNAHDQRGGGEKIAENDPLHPLKRGSEHLCRRPQGNIAMLAPSEDSNNG